MADIKVKKRDTLKFFSIIAGVIFVILSLGSVFVNLAELVVSLLIQFYYGYTINIYDILSIISTLIPIIVSALLMLVAALILFINKNSSAFYYPIGLLTYTVFMTWATLITNFIVARFVELLNWQIYIQLISPFISLVISLILVAILTLLFFVASCTFLKKVKFIPMFIIFALLAVGLVINFATVCLVIINNLPEYMHQLEFFRGIETVLIVFERFISPFIEIANSAGICFAVLLAAIGMCSKPKVVATADVIETGEIAVPAAETAEPAPEAEKSNGDEPEHDFTKGM